MKSLMFYTLIILLASGCTHRQKYPFEVFTHPVSLDSIPVFKKPDKFLAYLQPDEEAGWIARVIRQEKGFFKIILPQECNIRQKKVWVKAGDIGTIIQNYDSVPIWMYTEPTTASAPLQKITSSAIGCIYGIQDQFVLLKVTLNDGACWLGWVEKQYLCGNPYTTCN